MSSEKLKDEELGLMLNLIKRYAETEMDQFDILKFDTDFGKVYFSVSLSASDNGDSYTDVTEFMKTNTVSVE